MHAGCAVPSIQQSATPSHWSVVGLVLLFVLAAAVLFSARFRPESMAIEEAGAWKPYRFGFALYALVFLSFDMEMIFMYPWAVVFAEIGVMAFFDMLVFIALLSAALLYGWKMGVFEWE